MTTTVEEVLGAIRKGARSTSDLGTSFERLMVEYLRREPLYAEQYANVWRWSEWPGNNHKGDTGIDLVVQTRDGGYGAVQCKFYEPDHTLAKADIDSFFTASGKEPFTSRMIISTTDRWGRNAEDALDGQRIPVARVGLADLAASRICWDEAWPAGTGEPRLRLEDRKEPRPHQRAAIEAVLDGFGTHDRGKLIMACGTGKTFTALKIAEELARAKAEDETTRVLFLVPSIALLSQSLREWSSQCHAGLRSFAVCSDRKVARSSEDLSSHDLALPATTDPGKLVAQIEASDDGDGPLVVVFSTYQSIDVISRAQKAGLERFDLVVCDEAHRTTGVTLAGEDESQFVKVHDDRVIGADRRLYMTATPRLFSPDTKAAALENEAVLASMDDESIFGPELHRLGFGQAVSEDLLTDYRVLILTVDEDHLASSLQSQLADENNEFNLDDAAKIVGCWNGLAKRTDQAAAADGPSGFETDPAPMRRAVAFARSIAESKKVAARFAEVIGDYDRADGDALACELDHVDGTMNALVRNQKLDWLRAEVPDGQCRILSNARCLSEGVDIPALDAVLFLNPRNSVVDVVQSVGRVMRKSEGKRYGYIILPVGIPSDIPPDRALANNQRYKVIWQVLQALRAHDDRFNATINRIDLNHDKPDNIMVGTVGLDTGEVATSTPVDPAAGATAAANPSQLPMRFPVGEWRDAIYAKIVAKVGQRTYWAQWAGDIAGIASRHVSRINALITEPEGGKAEAFDEFVTELRADINPGISRTDAVDMLAQHLITRPVFDALFAGYDFSTSNPVSRSMEAMLATLGDAAIGKEAATLEDFYRSVAERASGIDNHVGRQKVITELYEQFFKKALPKTADAFGIVYTPIEVVDFILRATDQALQRHLGTRLTEPGVQVIDPFTGTGTFIVRALQSGLIAPEDLARKYAGELHANEILLLAYYIAAVNIEAAYHGLTDDGTYTPFDGIVLTDTFQLAENPATLEATMFPDNNLRVARQRALDIRVIVGNPPYSVGQTSANDDNANQAYPVLDARIGETYVAGSKATLKRNLYDSYIRALRWASDRIGDRGVIGFVSNGGYIDSNNADGLRKALADEFGVIYCYNLRGNQRTAGELSRREGGKIFDAASRSTVAITLLIKTGQPTAGCQIHYADIGDYLSRDKKLAMVAAGNLDSVQWQAVVPNAEGDWINRRSSEFDTFTPLGAKSPVAGSSPVFAAFSPGLITARDAWTYNFSVARLSSNVKRTIAFYNDQVAAFEAHYAGHGGGDRSKAARDFIDRDPRKISWDRTTEATLAKGAWFNYEPDSVTVGTYRPFTRQHVYRNQQLTNLTSRLAAMFPPDGQPNLGFYINGDDAIGSFAVLMADAVPDLHVYGKGGQFFPRYTYAESIEAATLFSGDAAGRVRSDNITAAALADYRATYGAEVSAEDVFFFTYGLLHSPDYRERFAADLKKMLPRIPKVEPGDFQGFVAAGQELSALHVGYETAERYPLAEVMGPAAGTLPAEVFRVTKMTWGPGKDRTRIVVNPHLTLAGIPGAAHRYQLGSRSALEWILDRYQVTVHKDSGIRNDPNDWSDDPRYIVDLVKRIVTVSVETMRIVDGLPPLRVLAGPTAE